MAEFILSAFADEYSPVFDEQLLGLAEHGIKYMEIRGVDGQNIADITVEKAREIKSKLDAAGIAVSSMGSPIGKTGVNDPFEPHLEQYKRVIESAHILECDRMRIFSFFIPSGTAPEECRGKVFDRMGKLLDIANAEGMILCHENEKGIYGDLSERCLDIQEYFKGEIKCIFDHANFICCNEEPYPKAFELLKDHIYYLHIKDADSEHHMTPAGDGIGRIPETIEALRAYDRTYVLTIEPHLRVFKGLDALQSKHGEGAVLNQYATAAEAFGAAVKGIRRYI
ncbi:MAG: TIM barrel protein [Eubacteriales bacterium]|jgi:sugar phosphate isomerase/epimerase|nr:TIM barrel protein [Eubacteriales bacterium]